MAFAALRVLDPIHRLAELDAFEPPRLLDALRDEALAAQPTTIDALGAHLDALGAVLDELERFAQKSMHVRLQTLVADPLPKQLMTLVTSTIVGYANDLPLLRRRILPALERNDRGSADAIMTKIEAAATRALGELATLRAGVLAIVEQVAAARLADATRLAADPIVPDDERAAWRRARVDLQQLAQRGGAITAGRTAERLALIDTPPEEPRPESTADRFSLLEID